MTRHTFLYVIFVSAFALCDASISLWASSVRNVSSEWSHKDRAATKILGIADVYPSYGTHQLAWSMSNKSSSAEYIVLEFGTALFVSDIFIFETYNAGSVVKISGWNSNDQKWEGMWTGRANRLEESRVFSPPLSSTRALIAIIRLDLDCSLSDSWCQIDAVQIRGSYISPVHSKPSSTSSLESQWAKSVVAASPENASKEILGRPQVYPSYGHSRDAWPRAGSLRGFIELQLEKPIHVVGVFVYETLNGGAVVQISAINATNTEAIWDGEAQLTVMPRIFSPLLHNVAMFADRIRLQLDSSLSDSSELDAVQVIGYPPEVGCRTRLARGEQLELGGVLCSTRGRYRAALIGGPDGALVVTLVNASQVAIKEIWRSQSYPPEKVNVLVHEQDGNVLLGFRDEDGDEVHAVWSSNTAGMETSVLQLDGDGVLHLYDNSNSSIWDSSRTYPDNYAGCFTDVKRNPDMRVTADLSANATVSRCIGVCRYRSLHFAAVQEGHLCLCGNKFGRHDQLKSLPERECWMSCTGDEEDVCGARLRNSVYATGLAPTVPTRARVHCDDGSWLPRAGACVAYTEPSGWHRCEALCEDKGMVFMSLRSSGLFEDLAVWSKNADLAYGLWLNVVCRNRRWQAKGAKGYEDVALTAWPPSAIRQSIAGTCESELLCVLAVPIEGSFQLVSGDCEPTAQRCLCQKPARTPPSAQCPRDWFKSGDRCYIYSQRSFSLSRAREYCTNERARMVRIDSREENEFVRRQFTPIVGPVWIGLQRMDGDYRWIDDGSLLDAAAFVNWDPDDSAVSSNDNCVMMTANGYWYAATCDNVQIRTICEKEESIPA